MTADSAIGDHARLVVDVERRVLQSTSPGFDVGERLEPSSWLAKHVLAIVDGLASGGPSRPVVARDPLHDRHWLLRGSVTSVDPWLATLSLVDATLVAHAERTALLPRLAHELRNVAFGMQSVLDALVADGAARDALGTHAALLRAPVTRLFAIAALLGDHAAPPAASDNVVVLERLLADVLGRREDARRPRVTGCEGASMIVGDAERLGGVVEAMLEGDEDPDLSLQVDHVVVDRRAYARVVVDRRERASNSIDADAVWDLSGGRRFDGALRLRVARDTVLAYGGDVSAERVAASRLRLCVRLPLLTGEPQAVPPAAGRAGP